MQTVYRFNSEDIKKLLAEKYHLTDPNKIKLDAWGSSQDGIYFSSAGCIFEFEVENDSDEKR